MRILRKAVLFLTLVACFSCSGPSQSNDFDFTGQVDIGGSFTNTSVKILVNDTVVFEDTFGSEAPLAGPLASKTFSVHTDPINIQVVSSDPTTANRRDTASRDLPMEGHDSIYILLKQDEGNTQILWQYEPYGYM